MIYELTNHYLDVNVEDLKSLDIIFESRLTTHLKTKRQISKKKILKKENN